MQAVILAAGKSSRFYPFNSFQHKSLVEVMGKPIILHTVEAIKRSGVKKIIIVVTEDSQIKKSLGNGQGYGVEIDYVVQKEPTGAGDGLLLAERKIVDDFFLLNASRIDFDLFKENMTSKKNKDVDVVLVGKRQNGLGRYGVVNVAGDKVLGLVEKPDRGDEPSNIRLVGAYLFSKNFLNTLKTVPREHYSLEDAISKISTGGKTRICFTKENISSLKYSWDLLELKSFLLSKISRRKIHDDSQVSKTAEIIGNVVIEDGARIMEGARIKGPVFVGKNSVVGNNAILRGSTVVERDCVIGANMEIKNSLVMKNSKVHSGFLGDSVLGEGVRIGAGFNSANKRIDRGVISIKSPTGGEVSTGLKTLGVIAGNNVQIGVNSSTMPGIILGEKATIGPGTTVVKNVAQNMKYYTQFKEIIEKSKGDIL